VRYKKQELLEWSHVPIPANPEALIQARSIGLDINPIKEWCKQFLDSGESFQRSEVEKALQNVSPVAVQVCMKTSDEKETSTSTANNSDPDYYVMSGSDISYFNVVVPANDHNTVSFGDTSHRNVENSESLKCDSTSNQEVLKDGMQMEPETPEQPEAPKEVDQALVASCNAYLNDMLSMSATLLECGPNLDPQLVMKLNEVFELLAMNFESEVEVEEGCGTEPKEVESNTAGLTDIQIRDMIRAIIRKWI
jgi:hypothetical protein